MSIIINISSFKVTNAIYPNLTTYGRQFNISSQMITSTEMFFCLVLFSDAVIIKLFWLQRGIVIGQYFVFILCEKSGLIYCLGEFTKKLIGKRL